MNRKKVGLFVLILMLIMCLLSGCSQPEVGFLNQMQSMKDLTVCESSGTIDLGLKQLPTGLNQEDADVFANLQKQFSQYNLLYDAKTNIAKQVAECSFTLNDKTTGPQQEILSLIISGNNIYIRVDELVSYLKTFNDKNLNQQLDKIFGDAKYISISSQELSELNGGTKVAFWGNVQKQQDLSTKFITGLKQAFSGYQTGMVSQSGNTYTMTMDKTAILNNIKPFLVYSINNIESIDSFIKDFLNGLDSDEMAMFALTPDMREAALDGLDKFTADVKTNRVQYLKNVDAINAQAAEGMKVIGDDSKIVISSTKVNDKNYKTSEQLAINVKDPENGSSLFNFAITEDDTTRAIDSFNVNTPADGVLSFTELQNRLPRNLSIDMDSKTVTLEQGIKNSTESIDICTINNSVYVPLNQVAAALNEKLTWNAATHQAWADKDGNKVYLAGLTENGCNYIKVRDLEKLGYEINWDPQLQIITVTQEW